MTDYDALCARLRADASLERKHVYGSEGTAEVLDEAADAIAALVARVAELEAIDRGAAR